jgi:hypothetical protein
VRHRQPLLRNLRRQRQLRQLRLDHDVPQLAVLGQQLHLAGDVRRRRQLPATFDRHVRQRELLPQRQPDLPTTGRTVSERIATRAPAAAPRAPRMCR